MAYTGDPANNPIDRLREIVGDVWEPPMLSDETYQWVLDKNEGNERRAALELMRMMLFRLTRGMRERTGDIEVYGAEYFNNYLKALQLILKDPNIAISLAVPYAGGISKSDMLANDLDPDNVTREFYIGFARREKLYNQCNPGPQDLSMGGDYLGKLQF
ncbi:hypothetical protein PJG4_065 [Pseudomonas phage JG004]|uniref:Uncharacterized protein n=1 Tax=Pseudomonas phage JG004 TaxID=757342 RepID=F4YDE1_9CAUD|nr:hypothetical protein PJG4_065 [Pseudomonas phage JG004]ADF58223.1 hypothetical protein PJG4_065 [Pseudomonas phage JG004]